MLKITIEEICESGEKVALGTMTVSRREGGESEQLANFEIQIEEKEQKTITRKLERFPLRLGPWMLVGTCIAEALVELTERRIQVFKKIMFSSGVGHD